jgi:hypothetical protein
MFRGSREFRGDGVFHVAHRGEDSEECKRTAAYDLFIVDEYLELAVVPVLQLYVLAQVLANAGRRTGGLDARYSVAAAADSYRHQELLS